MSPTKRVSRALAPTSISRYRAHGWDGLQDRGSRPKYCPHATPVKVVADVLTRRVAFVAQVSGPGRLDPGPDDRVQIPKPAHARPGQNSRGGPVGDVAWTTVRGSPTLRCYPMREARPAQGSSAEPQRPWQPRAHPRSGSRLTMFWPTGSPGTSRSAWPCWGGQTHPDQTPPSLAKRLSRTLHRTSKKAGPTAKPFTSNPVRTDAPQPWLHFYNTHGRAAASEAATHQQVQPTY